MMILKKYLFLFMLLQVATSKAYSQINFCIDTTDRRINTFRHTIKTRENVVKFIEYALTQHSIPTALSNLALIESSFNSSALSNADAAGIWQLTASHAACYGLAGADRYDVLKSTRVAMQSITNLYNRYYDWRIVVAAYNCGERNVNKAIIKAHSTDYNVFCAYLPAETKEHVYKFLLACYATGQLQSLNLSTPGLYATPTQHTKQLEINYSVAVTSTVVSGGFVLSVIAEKLEMPLDSVRSLNPGFDNELITTGAAKLVLPVDKMPDFLLQKNEILTASLN